MRSASLILACLSVYALVGTAYMFGDVGCQGKNADNGRCLASSLTWPVVMIYDVGRHLRR